MKISRGKQEMNGGGTGGQDGEVQDKNGNNNAAISYVL
jgi:hypothetical protein